MQCSPKSVLSHGVKIVAAVAAHKASACSYLSSLTHTALSEGWDKSRTATGEKMVQIQLPEQEKPAVEQEEKEKRRRDVESGRGQPQPQHHEQMGGEAPLLPTSVHHSVARERRQTTNKRSVLHILQLQDVLRSDLVK